MATVNASEYFQTTDSALTEPRITPLLGRYVSTIMIYVVGSAMVGFVGLCGMFTNVANICVYLKMGIKETTNMKFFTLSVLDLLVCVWLTVSQTTPYQYLGENYTPYGYLWVEIGVSGTNISYPCLGCSAGVTAFLSVERYLCIATPLKVKDILTPLRTRAIILVIITYQCVLLVLFFAYPGPPYQKPDSRRALYFNLSFSAPTIIFFFIVSISTVLLIIKLRQSLEWRNETSAQSNKGLGSSKEKKVTRSVLAICIIFIVCFSLNIALFIFSSVNGNFSPWDPYLGNLFRTVYAFTCLCQVMCSSVNIFVYYTMSSRYREIFNSLFCCGANEKA